MAKQSSHHPYSIEGPTSSCYHTKLPTSIHIVLKKQPKTPLFITDSVFYKPAISNEGVMLNATRKSQNINRHVSVLTSDSLFLLLFQILPSQAIDEHRLFGEYYKVQGITEVSEHVTNAYAGKVLPDPLVLHVLPRGAKLPTPFAIQTSTRGMYDKGLLGKWANNGIQNSMEVILPCWHPTPSTEWLAGWQFSVNSWWCCGTQATFPYKNSHEILMRISWENDILMRIFQFSWDFRTSFFYHN